VPASQSQPDGICAHKLDHPQARTSLLCMHIPFESGVLIPSLDCVCHEHEHAHCVPSTFHIYRRTALVDLSRILSDCLIQYLVYPDHIYVVPMYCVIVQLYGNSFMAALNMRPYLRQTSCTGSRYETWPDISTGPSDLQPLQV
jgi:hypothetical protein